MSLFKIVAIQTILLHGYLKAAQAYCQILWTEKKVGEIAYTVKLPQGAPIHLVFHVQLLKEKVGEHASLGTQLPSYQDEDVVVGQERILQTRIVTKDGLQILQRLIKWLNLSLQESNLGESIFILAQFPKFKSSQGQEESLRVEK